MHTFFINTSGQKLDNYSDILEIQREQKKIVPIDCRMRDWCSEDDGYKSCVRRMGEIVDSYKDVNNNFNLIIYVDLIAYKRYTEIPMENHRERFAFLYAINKIFKYYVKNTIVKELVECGRMPNEVLVIYEENKKPSDEDKISEDGKNLIRNFTREILGIPEEEEFTKIVKELYENKKLPKAEDLKEKLKTSFDSVLQQDLFSMYEEQVDVFFEESKRCEFYEKTLKNMLDEILDVSESHSQFVNTISFVTNRRAGVSNKQEYVRRNLRLSLYILKCIEDKTIYIPKNKLPRDSDAKIVKSFPEIDWNKLAHELERKEKRYKIKHGEMQNISESFNKLNLAPKLYEYDNVRFGLDKYGKKEKDVEESLLPRGTFENFVGKDKLKYQISEKSKPEDFKNAANAIYTEQKDYLDIIKQHIYDVLPNYAGRSEENDPPILSKRKVSVLDENFEDPDKDYRYAKKDRTEETKKINNVKNVSESAYKTTVVNYMNFCAGRSVAINDIKVQCDEFNKKIDQVEKSIKNIHKVTFGLLILAIVLYIPFLAIQFNEIFNDVVAVFIAMCSLSVPIILIVVISQILRLKQKKRYYKLWEEFKKDIEKEGYADNKSVVSEYDKLLSVYIPSLRFTYEYKLDVDFYLECCKMARAKMNHHLQKIQDRIVTVRNIIEDLELDEDDYVSTEPTRKKIGDVEVDYSVSFCTGDVNTKFYSIIEDDFLKTIDEK